MYCLISMAISTKQKSKQGLMQGKLFQRCRIFRTFVRQRTVSGGKYTKSMKKETVMWIIKMHLFLFTNSAQRKLISTWTQSIRNGNKLSLHYNLGFRVQLKVNYKSYPQRMRVYDALNHFKSEDLKVRLYLACEKIWL